MGLPWVRLDTQWPHNPKFLALVEDRKWRAIAVHWAAVGYAGVHNTGGVIPALALPVIHGTKREATDLSDVNLWVPVAGGWEINGWAEYQRDDAAEDRSAKAKRAAQVRWAKQASKGADLHAV